MSKTFLPLLASLFLCGAATGALAAALSGPATIVAQNTVTPQPSNTGRMQPASGADMAQRHAARCQDRYARQTGRMTYLETRLNLTAAQRPLFSAWRTVRLDIAKRHADECARTDVSQDRATISPVDRMTRMEGDLKERIADLDAERSPFTALYNALSPDQQKALAPRRR